MASARSPAAPAVGSGPAMPMPARMTTFSVAPAMLPSGASLPEKPAPPPAGPWLHAWHDPMANLKTFACCVRVADAHGDGDFKLVVADWNKRMRIYKGTTLQSEHVLLETPAAVGVYYPELTQPLTPSLAVASGPFLYIYRNLRPYFKFTLPPVAVNAEEVAIWETLTKDVEGRLAEAVAKLTELRNGGLALQAASQELLSLDTEPARLDFARSQAALPQPVQSQNVITCMESLKKGATDERAVSMLVLGTEQREVILMEPSGTAVNCTIPVPDVPVFLSCVGLFDVDYRVVVACRDGRIYSIKKGRTLGAPIELEAQASALCASEKHVYVACMDHAVHCFQYKGKKSFSLYLPCAVSNMELLDLKRAAGNEQALIVALSSGEVRTYNKQHLVHSFTINDTITALRLGPYGREEAALVLVSRSGALTVKLLDRKAKLDAASASGPPPEQDIPLQITKTRLYEEQMERERAQAVDIHRTFQRDLCKLRLNAARTYVKVLSDNAGPISNARGSTLRMDVQVQGLGPTFLLKISLKNAGLKPLYGLALTFAFDHSLFRIHTPSIAVPALVPGLLYAYAAPLTCVAPTSASAAVVRVMLANARSVVPAISAIVNMPASELSEDA